MSDKSKRMAAAKRMRPPATAILWHGDYCTMFEDYMYLCVVTVEATT